MRVAALRGEHDEWRAKEGGKGGRRERATSKRGKRKAPAERRNGSCV
jgi:hypothetical protein